MRCKGVIDSYYFFPPPDKVQALQKQGLLPEPLPDYSTYFTSTRSVIHCSLWIVLLSVALYTLFKEKIVGKRTENQPACES